MNKEKIFNIPNVLSLIRIILIPCFIITYFSGYYITSAAILLASGFTDVLDGFIARRFNLITNIGKILDPAADKLTQVAIWISLTIKFSDVPGMIIITVIFFLKELLMLIGGIKILKVNKPIASSKWFGKIGTFIFYCVTIYIIAVTDVIDLKLMFLLVLAVAVYMLFAFLMYIPVYLNIKRSSVENK